MQNEDQNSDTEDQNVIPNHLGRKDAKRLLPAPEPPTVQPQLSLPPCHIRINVSKPTMNMKSMMGGIKIDVSPSALKKRFGQPIKELPNTIGKNYEKTDLTK